MTFLLRNTPNAELHACYRSLEQREKTADARADENAEAERAWGHAWDEWVDAKDFMWTKPVESHDDIVVKLEIVERYAANFDDVSGTIATLREQIETWRRRRG
jgi:hypothetical protein